MYGGMSLVKVCKGKEADKDGDDWQGSPAFDQVVGFCAARIGLAALGVLLACNGEIRYLFVVCQR